MSREKVRNLGLDFPLPPTSAVGDPDCGLETRTAEEARAKLALIMSGVREIREAWG